MVAIPESHSAFARAQPKAILGLCDPIDGFIGPGAKLHRLENASIPAAKATPGSHQYGARIILSQTIGIHRWKAIRRAKGLYLAASNPRQASVNLGHPDGPFPILQQSPHLSDTKTLGQTEVLESGSAQPCDAALGSHPQESPAIFQQCPYLTLRQAVATVEMPECQGLRMQCQSNPQDRRQANQAAKQQSDGFKEFAHGRAMKGR